MTLVLVVDDTSIIREPIAAALTAAGYQTVCASDGREALAALDRQTPDVMVLDLSMPEMSGLQVLEAMRRRPATANTPVILLTASADRDTVLSAAQWGVRDYVLKAGFSLTQLLSRVQKYAQPGQGAHPAGAAHASPGEPTAPVAPAQGATAPAADGATAPAASAAPATSPTTVAPAAAAGATGPVATPHVDTASPLLRPLLTREQCLARAEAALEGKSLTGVGAQVIAEAATRRGSVNELSGLIARDPLLSARVLQTANSAAYAGNRPVVNSIPDAVRQIGCTAVRNIASALGLFDAMPTSGPDGFSPVRYWQHSFAVAALCQRLAGEGGDAGIAYLVGLCHDLGEILFHTHFAAEYRQVLEAEAAGAGRRDELERRLMGITHGELARTILRRMGLPDVIRDPIERFHEPARTAAGGTAAGGTAAGFGRDAAGRLARLLRAADLYANGLLLCASGMEPVSPLTRAECKTMTGVEDPPRPDVAEFRSQVMALTGLLARLTPADTAEMTRLPYDRTGSRVWLARDATLSAFDPLAQALWSMAEIRIQNRLPNGPEEWADCQKLIVTAQTAATPNLTAADIRRSIESAGGPRPVLWLVGRSVSDPPAAPGRLNDPTPELWPASLERVYHFVRATEAPAAVAA